MEGLQSTVFNSYNNNRNDNFRDSTGLDYCRMQQRCKQSLQSMCQKLCENLSSYFTQEQDQLAREEDAHFDEKDLRTITENYKRKGAKAEFRA
ncbi:MAG: hypothetical protein HXS48_23820 [Theionarchaea archaeon]|nr:MAG: hypothetical protein AYK19_21510 [Theionarchaea archaeon DG-70-1]MBU7029980.1 hypothetical protein [Theionarchaea archaeon]